MKKNLSAKSIKRLREIVAYLKAEPKRFDMNFWGFNFDPQDKVALNTLHGGNTIRVYDSNGTPAMVTVASPDDLPPCGTAACLAGTGILLFAPKKYIESISCKTSLGTKFTVFGNQTENKAQELLGLPDTDIFFARRWPRQFENAYNKAKTLTTAKGRANARLRAAERMVEIYIELDGNWQVICRKYGDSDR